MIRAHIRERRSRGSVPACTAFGSVYRAGSVRGFRHKMRALIRTF
jgi:hypothetical protein